MRARDLLLDIEPLRTSPDFRAIFIARVVSLFGLGMAAVALAFQVYDLTGSTVDVAITGVVMSVTVLLGSLWGGWAADRTDRRKLIIRARGAAALAFAGLAVNAFLPEPQLWAVQLCVAWDGLATGVSVTALMAVAPTLVRPDQLPAAGALISLTGEIGSIAAPLLGGVLLAAAGPGPVFAFAALTTAVTTALVARIRPLPPVRKPADPASPVSAVSAVSADDTDSGRPEDGADGGSLLVALRYAVRDRVLGGLLLLGLVTAVFSMPAVLFPELVAERFGGEEIALGLLYTAPAVGSVLTSATSGWLGRTARPGRLLLAAAFTGGLATIGFGLSGHLWTAALALAVAGAAGTVYEILEYALIQHNTPDHLRGRIVSVVTAQGTTGGMAGDAEVALLSRWFGPGAAAQVNGAVCAAAAVLIALLVPGIRRATLPAPDRDGPGGPAPDPGAHPAADGDKAPAAGL
ncbi:MFS transporter [Streptomyces sp. NPDC003691]